MIKGNIHRQLGRCTAIAAGLPAQSIDIEPGRSWSSIVPPPRGEAQLGDLSAPDSGGGCPAVWKEAWHWEWPSATSHANRGIGGFGPRASLGQHRRPVNRRGCVTGICFDPTRRPGYPTDPAVNEFLFVERAEAHDRDCRHQGATAL